MTNPEESKALEYLHTSILAPNQNFEHRVLYEAALQPTDEEPGYPRALAMQLARKTFIVFTIDRKPISEELGDSGKAYEFIALFSDRDKAINAVFSLITK